VAGHGESDPVYHCPPRCGPHYMMESPSHALARGSLCGQLLCLVDGEGFVTLSHFHDRGGNVFRAFLCPHDYLPNFVAQSQSVYVAGFGTQVGIGHSTGSQCRCSARACTSVAPPAIFMPIPSPRPVKLETMCKSEKVAKITPTFSRLTAQLHSNQISSQSFADTSNAAITKILQRSAHVLFGKVHTIQKKEITPLNVNYCGNVFSLLCHSL